MPYSAEEIIVPFWADYASESRGRDPLAIQNSSVVIYSKTVVGITNVTNRIRYTGFYCWLLEKIIKTISKRNSLIEQIRYIRRAELLMAYIMVKEFPSITGVSGSDFAGRNLNPSISLINGADWVAKTDVTHKIYWISENGIFGQYYSGVLRDLGLINHPLIDLNIYTTTDKGKELAEAFRQNIKEEEELFWQSVYKGSINEEELSELKTFALHLIPAPNKESSFYQKMLLSEDKIKLLPTFHRRNTIKLILQFLNSENNGVEKLTSSFLKYNYNTSNNLGNLNSDTSISWYLFEINELLHVAFEYFHACFLFTIEFFPLAVDDCINKLINGINEILISQNIDASVIKVKDYADIIRLNNIEVYEYYNEMEFAFKKKRYSECLLNAIRIILTVYQNCSKHIIQLKEYAALSENNFNRNGYAIDLFEDLIESKKHLSISEYTKSIILSAINLHTFSSYSKTKIGDKLVHNYIIENDLVSRLRETLPSRTSPRLQNVLQYLMDLGWIEKDDRKIKISVSGIEILNAL